MLILSRKIEEAIRIGDSVTIKILGIHEGQVKIGIEAPKEVKVYRSELYDLIQKENLQASKSEKVSVSKAALVLRSKNVKQDKQS
ncbi:MAG: carbon storage regulator CsrA [Ignavibacteriales bacterium]|nr:carbon storage regulator CsrA [Ignavibacteriales bacterium]